MEKQADSARGPTPSLADFRIVLVEPQHPGNIGGAARAMKTMGLGDLALVRSQALSRPASRVARRQRGGRARCREGIRLLGRRHRRLRLGGRHERAPLAPHSLADCRCGPSSPLAWRVLVSAASRPAILFGREASGLANEELQRCNWHVVIPANPAYSFPQFGNGCASGELRQALLAPLGAEQAESTALAADWDRPLASAAQMAGFYGQLQRVLEAIEFQTANTPHQAMTRLRRLFGRLGVDETEVAILRGVLTHVERALAKQHTLSARDEGLAVDVDAPTRTGPLTRPTD